MNSQMSPSSRSFLAGAAFLLAAFAAHAQAPVGDVQAGKNKAEMCIGCHGIPGYQNSFPEIHKVPMISGQSGPYIVSALNAYKKGERRHPSMRGISGSLSDQDMSDLGAFYAAQTIRQAAEQPSKAPSEAVKALLERGACAACHGANYSSPTDPSYPKIGGQHADYLYVALKSYTVQNNDKVGRSNGIMAGIVGQYTLAELRAMAKYLGSIEGEVGIEIRSRFR